MLINKDHDNAIRWKEGERLHHLFERQCNRFDAANNSDHLAVNTSIGSYTYRNLDNRANQLARYLIGKGIQSGDRVGLLFDKSINTYAALLVVLKVNAAYVPLDASFPNDRIGFILSDADASTVLSLDQYSAKFSEFAGPKILVDTAEWEISRQNTSKLSDGEVSAPKDQLCYIIYTSGTTGKPKGVAIDHPSICNFVKVAGEVYGYSEKDRVYQGMTIAFDFSVEELWVPLLKGATLIPGNSDTSMVGEDLADFLMEHKITALCCVPTLLATIEKDLPNLRLILVSGEACPNNLVSRWCHPKRTFLNAYGPTEATVTATLAELKPDKPVTIGVPLPTYTMVILDEQRPKTIADGGLGEIGIAGIGLAEGYLHRPDLTTEKFIPDFLGIPNNPSKRIYRTGDLGCINSDGEIEFHGRIDTQVKIRGYRIELTEIESVLMQVPNIVQTVVDTYESEPGVVELVAYYNLKSGVSKVSASEISEILRSHLPAYMVPAYIEYLPVMPMASSNKVDRKNLPPPSGSRFVVESSDFVAPENEKEAILAEALAEIMEVQRLSTEDHFFDNIGAHSLLMAQFCAKIRQHDAFAHVSMQDVYLNPTIKKLAEKLTLTGSTNSSPAQQQEPTYSPSTFAYYFCGALQLLSYVAYIFIFMWLLISGIEWVKTDNPTAIYNFCAQKYLSSELINNLYSMGCKIQTESSVAQRVYFRMVTFASVAFVGLSAIPIALKWLLIGRWKEQVIPIWSLRYFRFWLVKTLVQTAPMALFIGTPIYNLYLRLLGAKIGKHTIILSRFFPVCTDLISIGDRTTVLKESILQGYKAQSNYIYTGRITIGNSAFVGEAGILDINTRMDDHTQLGHVSSLHDGQRIKQGQRFHGSPAELTSTNYCTVEDKKCTSLTRGLFAIFQLAAILAVVVPILTTLLYFLSGIFAEHSSITQLSYKASATELLNLAIEIIPLSVSVFFGGLILGLLLIYLIPRLLNLFLKEDKTYPLYGLHYYLYLLISRVSNSGVYNLLFGDSSMITSYQKWAGYTLHSVIQTGANFGLDTKHDNPFLCDLGTRTMVSDGLTMMNAKISHNSFILSKVKIGDQNYLGNRIHYPADGKVGANCLLATKVMIPVDGEIRTNVGLLGSPCFEIPRTVERDKHFGPYQDEAVIQKRLRMKTRYNVATLAAYLLANGLLFTILLFSGAIAFLFYQEFGYIVSPLYIIFIGLFSVFHYIFIERASIGFKGLHAQIVSMYDESFWLHERYWKFSGNPLNTLFNGTPFKNLLTRLLGVKIGQKVFDDGSNTFDKTLITLGDYVNLNKASVLQAHSLEEGVFKAGKITIGNHCSIGCGAFVHYETVMADNVRLEPDSFLMKGESLQANTIWQGNPAKRV